MRTGVSPKRIATRNFLLSARAPSLHPRYSFRTPRARSGSYTANSNLLSPQVNLLETPSTCLCTRSLTTRQQFNPYFFFLRKEVIQPHLPIRLPCYDFTPVIRPAFGGSFLTVRSPTSGISDSHGVTGGVYKTRERIHRDMLIRDY